MSVVFEKQATTGEKEKVLLGIKLQVHVEGEKLGELGLILI